MCKNIFIGTDSILEDVPFNKDKPNFHLEKITGEFLQVIKNFSTKNIYYVGTSRGCGCDFSLIHNQINHDNDRHETFLQFGARKLRTYLGTQENWEKRKAKQNQELTESTLFYLAQTNRLIDLIESIVKKGQTVELYCCWSGNYDAATEERKSVSIETIRTNFEIEEGQILTFQ